MASGASGGTASTGSSDGGGSATTDTVTVVVDGAAVAVTVLVTVEVVDEPDRLSSPPQLDIKTSSSTRPVIEPMMSALRLTGGVLFTNVRPRCGR